MNRREQQDLYAQQRRELEEKHAREGIDVFLSPFDILRTSDGLERSYCTWPEGVASSLPLAECIAFTGIRGEKRWYTIVPWDSVVNICRALLKRVPGVEPARFAVVMWPNEDQLRQLEQVAVLRN